MLTLLLVSLTCSSLSSPFEFDPAPHIVATGSMLLVVGIAEGLVKPTLAGSFDCLRDPTGRYCGALHLWGFDRGVVNYKNAAWRRVSDVGMISAIALPVAAAFLDNADSPQLWRDAGTDVLVALESVAVATFVNGILKFAIRRPRPGLYSPNQPTFEGQMSFPSGHAAATAAGAAAYSTTFWLRHPHSAWRYGVMGGGIALTALTSFGRVAGGMHFYSDVLAGGVLGGAVGFMVPYLLRRVPVALEVAPPGVVQLSVAF